MRFKFLTGDMDWREYGGKWISKKLNNGDFDYWMVIELINMNEHVIDPDYTYWVILSAVSPDEAKEHLDRAYECYGIEDIDEKTDFMNVEVLHGYGISAPLWDDMGNNYKDLMKEAHRQASISETLFGFYMDKPKNRIGATGWDVIQGVLDPRRSLLVPKGEKT